MKIKTSLEGLKQVNDRLNETIALFPRVTLKGLLATGLRIQRDSQEHVPVAVGKLKASAYARPARDRPDAVEVGFSAGYAAAVHSKTEMKLKGKPRRKPKGTFYWGPNGEALFLQHAVERARAGLLRDLARMNKGAKK